MKTHTGMIQGDAAWHAHRAQHFNASDAPAMLGCSPYMTRTQLLHQLHTGIAQEHDAATERRFADGHRFEAMARPLAEKIIGDDLAPVVGSEGELSASFDGLTMMGDTAFEHKTLNDELRGCMGSDCIGRDLPKHYQVQMEQQLMVSGAERVLFMATKWTPSGEITEERNCWYASDSALRAEIIAGWKQFAIDLAAYVPTAVTEPKPTGHAPESLPALRIELRGEVTASNLAEFKANALAVFAGINRTLTTDAEFADAEKTVKWCGDVEDRLKAAKEHALSQTASIDSLFKTIDDISAESKRVRLDLDKLVTARKAAIKLEIVQEGKSAYEAHENALQKECGAWTMLTPPDFAGCIKGLRTVDSIRNAVQTTLANGKIKADESARVIRAALAALDDESIGFENLFRDRMSFMNLSPDAVRLTVRDRLASHKAAEEKRMEAQREAIRAEELAKLQREQEAQRRRDEETAVAASVMAALAESRQAEAMPDELQQALENVAVDLITDMAFARVADTSKSVANVVPMRAPTSPPTLTLGAIGERLGFTVTAEFIGRMGFQGTKVRSATLFHESDVLRIIDSIVAHLRTVQAQQRAA